MKKTLLVTLIVVAAVLLNGCKDDKPSADTITFGTSADYPPFQYYEDGKIIGFDVEVAEAIAHHLGKKIVIKDMQFSALLPSLQNGDVDAVISTLTITPERQKSFDFSNSYYTENLVMVYPKQTPVAKDLTNKKIACQLGSTMEEWLRKNAPEAELVAMDNNNQAIEALKAGHVDGVLIDKTQGHAFSKQNPELEYSFFTKSDAGYAVAVTKGSSLRKEINKALKALERDGELEKLKHKWLK